MKPEQVEKLLGGYATGTLTAEERAALFQEALHNQSLFDALADEEGLRELLADPAARRRLLDSLGPAPVSFTERLRGFFWRPLPMSAAAALVALALAVVMVRQPEPPVEIAKNIPQQQEEAAVPPPAAAAPEPAAPPAPAEKKVTRVLEKDAEKERSTISQDLSARADAPVAEPPPPPPPPKHAPAPAEAELKKAEAAERPAEPKLLAESIRREARDEVLRSIAKMADVALDIEHFFERREASGDYSRLTGVEQLHAGDAVRLSVRAIKAGTLVAVMEQDGVRKPLMTSFLREGQQMRIPASGDLPSQPGERYVEISFTPGDPAAAMNQGFRTRAVMGPQSSTVTANPLRIRLNYRE